jgi:hypothetical protein
MEDSKGNVVNHFEAGSNCQVFNGPVSGCVFAMPGSNVSQQNSPAASQIAGKVLDGERLVRALKECKPFIWGNAAYSIPFCVCRDLFHLPNNASLFERMLAEAGCEIPDGTINNAMSRNPWMRLHAGKWQQQGVMERVLRLRDRFIQEMQKE